MTGPKGSGKSTWLKVMSVIAYRSIRLGGASSEASLVRLVDKWRWTLLIEEADFHDSSLFSTFVKAMNVGFDEEGIITKCDKENPDVTETLSYLQPEDSRDSRTV